MRGEVNEAIFAERGVERSFAAGGEVADDLAVADQRGDPPRLPVGRRKSAQFMQGAGAGPQRIVPPSFTHLRRRRTPARSPADTAIGGRVDRVGKDYDAALGRLPHSRLPNYRRQRRGRRNHDHLMINDQRSVGGGRTGRRGDGETGRLREIWARILSVPLSLRLSVSPSFCPAVPP